MENDFQTVVTSVNNILNDTNLTAMTESVVERLVSLGYIPIDEDAWVIAFSTQKTVNHVLNQTNQTAVPIDLTEVVVDMVCGEVLNAKFRSGQLSLDSMDFAGVIQEVTQGDTKVTFNANGSDEEKLKGLLSWLMHGKESDLLCYRKMRW